AGAVAHDMEDAGLLLIVLGGISRAIRLDAAIAVEREANLEPSYPRRLAALSVEIAEDAARVGERLRLSNADRLVLEESELMSRIWPTPPGLDQAKEVLYRAGRSRFVDCLVHAAARGREDHSGWANLLRSLESVGPQEFPLTGKDVLAVGIGRGPQVGTILARLEEWWIAEQFGPDRAELLDKLQQMAGRQ
ncbi:MAG: CCA tRNA nucleotidyltransferase, partial [Alphaproteobacteria bacterium]